MAATDKFSPNMSLNSSLGLNASLTNSPSMLDLSEKFKFLMPEMSSARNRRSWTPCALQSTTPDINVSPISKTGSPSPFLKRRDPKDRELHRKELNKPMEPQEKSNANLDMTLSVKTILKDLNLSQLNHVFEQEEIDLTVFFTLSDDDLKEIGIDDDTNRKKIIDFINDFSTPQKPKKIPRKNILYRH